MKRRPRDRSSQVRKHTASVPAYLYLHGLNAGTREGPYERHLLGGESAPNTRRRYEVTYEGVRGPVRVGTTVPGRAGEPALTTIALARGRLPCKAVPARPILVSLAGLAARRGTSSRVHGYSPSYPCTRVESPRERDHRCPCSAERPRSGRTVQQRMILLVPGLTGGPEEDPPGLRPPRTRIIVSRGRRSSPSGRAKTPPGPKAEGRCRSCRSAAGRAPEVAVDLHVRRAAGVAGPPPEVVVRGD